MAINLAQIASLLLPIQQLNEITALKSVQTDTRQKWCVDVEVQAVLIPHHLIAVVVILGTEALILTAVGAATGEPSLQRDWGSPPQWTQRGLGIR